MNLPKDEGFYSHGEFETHDGTIIMLPYRSDIWRENARIAQNQIINIANTIINYEKVYLCTCFSIPKHLAEKIDKRISVINISYNDIWSRDISPNFVLRNEEIRGVCWGFNSWGGMESGAYYPWDKDAAFASSLLDKLDYKKYIKNDIVLEGGSVITDGVGTLLTTKSVLLNKNRNPNVSIDKIEFDLKNYFCVDKIIWFERGLCLDETDGHIDNLCNFVKPGEICIAWTDNPKHMQYKVVHDAYEILTQEVDNLGNHFIIHKIPLPETSYITEQEAKGINCNPNSTNRIKGFPLIPSYINYYLLNGAVLVPIFNCELDRIVLEKFSEIFRDRDIIPIDSREFLLGGGGLHCILHEIPKYRR